MQSQKGFTLIELMLVVTIIGILASITLPAYQSYVQEAANNACLAESNTYARRVFTDLQLSKPTTQIPAPVSRACREINDGNSVTRITTFTATARAPGNAAIACDLSADVICTKSTNPP